MNKRQSAHVNMMTATIDCCKLNPISWQWMPNFAEKLSTLENKQLRIHELSEKQAVNNSGITQEKTVLKTTMIQLTAETASKVGAYANAIKDTKLEHAVNINEAQLKRLPDATLPDSCKMIHSKAAAHLAQLAPYLLTEATQATLLTAIEAFTSIQTAPREGQIQHSQITRQLAELFDETQQILEEMDKLVDMAKLSDPEFYSTYYESRRLVEKGGRTLALKIHAVSSNDNSNQKGVRILVYTNGHSSTEPAEGQTALLRKTTADKGNCLVRSLEAGAYLVCASKEGYEAQNHTVYINEGEMSLLELRMKPLN